MKVTSTKSRVLALDALRGWAILGMVLSGVVPMGVLPTWMYHAQLPPPKHAFNPAIAGLTWVDLVFPFFLFALGAALPLALNRFRQTEKATKALLLRLGQRFGVLAFFAFALQHLRPYALDPSPDAWAWVTALIGFVFLAWILVRLPTTWLLSEQRFFRVLGWVGILALLASLTYPNGMGFSTQRRDIILLFLAHMAFWGGFIWWFTRDYPFFRLGIMAAIVALRLSVSYDDGSWAAVFWAWNPVKWLFEWEFLRYLLIVLPGTMAGDWLMGHQKPVVSALASKDRFWLNAMAWMALGLVCVVCIGLQARQSGQTVMFAAVLLVLLMSMMHHATLVNWDLLPRLLQWGGFWLMLGLFVEAFEGGIKKDEPTYSYFFVTTGLAMLLLFSLVIWMDLLGKQGGILGLLTENGQNPMLAYILMGNVIFPLLHLSGFQKWIHALTDSPFLGLGRSVLYTLFLAFLVKFATRKGFVFRS